MLFGNSVVRKDFANKGLTIDKKNLYRYWISEDQKELEYVFLSYFGLFVLRSFISLINFDFQKF